MGKFMGKFFKTQDYVITAAPDEVGVARLESAGLLALFQRAAIKKGFQTFSSSAWETVCVVRLEKDIPFNIMQQVIDDISSATKHSVAISADTDLLGKKIVDYPAKHAEGMVYKELILRNQI